MIEGTQKMIEEGNKRVEELLARMHNDFLEIQRLIDEGNKRLERILLEIDKSTKEIFSEILIKENEKVDEKIIIAIFLYPDTKEYARNLNMKLIKGLKKEENIFKIFKL